MFGFVARTEFVFTDKKNAVSNERGRVVDVVKTPKTPRRLTEEITVA